MLKKVSVFYSWQSDTKAAANRTLIREALDAAAVSMAQDAEIGIEMRIDQDTQGVPGSPDIGATILEKIGSADVLVADVTLGLETTSKKASVPNPNVLIEVGYALHALGKERVVLVMNTACGGGPELLPFDLRQRRVLTFRSEPEGGAPGARAEPRRSLTAQLTEALRAVAAHVKPSSAARASFELRHETVRRISNEQDHSYRHDYQLIARLCNESAATVGRWHIDIELPRALQQPGVTIGALVAERSTPDMLFYRMTEEAGLGKPLRPGDYREMKIPYMVDDARFHLGPKLMDQQVVARAYVEDELVGHVLRRVEDVQNF